MVGQEDTNGCVHYEGAFDFCDVAFHYLAVCLNGSAVLFFTTEGLLSLIQAALSDLAYLCKN